MIGATSTTNSFVTVGSDRQNSCSSVRVQPLVTAAVLDAYARRPEGEYRAVGTLTGYMSEGGVLEVVDAFAVPHSDSGDQISFDKGRHKTMCKLRQQVHPKELVIGWFSVEPKPATIDDPTISIHSFYKNAKDSLFQGGTSGQFGSLANPLYLHLDTRNFADDLTFKAFTNYSSSSVEGTQRELQEQAKAEAEKNEKKEGGAKKEAQQMKRKKDAPSCITQFYQIPVEQSDSEDGDILDMLLHYRVAERQNGDSYSAQQNKPALEGLDAFQRNLQDLLSLFKQAKQYTEKIVAGEEEPNVEVGRELTRVLASRALDNEKFDSLCDGAMKDTLLTTFLSHLTRAQIMLAENIGRIVSTADRQQ